MNPPLVQRPFYLRQYATLDEFYELLLRLNLQLLTCLELFDGVVEREDFTLAKLNLRLQLESGAAKLFLFLGQCALFAEELVSQVVVLLEILVYHMLV